MSVKFTGFAAAVPFAWGVVDGIVGGYISDILVRGGVPPVKSRRYPATIALCGAAACTIAAAFVTSNALAIAFISASLFLLYVTSTCAWALSSVAAPTNCTASIGAMQNFGGYLGGALAPTVTGLIVQQTGSFVPALVGGRAHRPGLRRGPISSSSIGQSPPRIWTPSPTRAPLLCRRAALKSSPDAAQAPSVRYGVASVQPPAPGGRNASAAGIFATTER